MLEEQRTESQANGSVLTIAFDYSAKDDNDAWRHQSRPLLPLTAASCIALLLALAISRMQSAPPTYGVLTVAAFIVSIPLINSLVASSRKRAPVQFMEFHVIVTADAEGIRNRTPYVNQWARWDAVETIFVAKFGIVVEAVAFKFFIPRRVFATDANLQSFFAQLQHLKSAAPTD